MTYGEYKVIGRREYRGHKPGSVFAAQLEPLAEERAIRRGDIRLIRRVTPTIPEGAVLPDSWLASVARVSSGAPEGASSTGGGGG